MTMLSSTWMPELNPDWVQQHAEHRETTLQYLRRLGDPTAELANRAATTPVSQVMVRGVVAAREQARFHDIVQALARNHVGAVPVLDEQRRVVGMISASDLLAHTHPMLAETARELMTAPAVVTTPGATVESAARLAAHKRVQRLPVVDADGVLVGIVARADLLRVFLRSDAEPHEDQNPARAGT
jgi:CBS domain-containing protein